MDEIKYVEKCEKNRANATVRKRSQAFEADNDKDKDKDNDKDKVELIYNSYPTRCVVGGRNTGKSVKCKHKIKTLLKTLPSDKLIETIKWYVEDCKKTKTYMMNFYTFLNNIPEIPDEYKPVITDVKPKHNELQ